MIIPDLYLDNNYINMGAVISAPFPFVVVVSSRGGGKTYGALQYVIEQRKKFLYLRRTRTILDLVTDPAYSPFKRLNADKHWNIRPEMRKGLGFFTDADTAELVGYAGALSTFANVRGFDASDLDVVIWDEFIPEPHERQTFNSFSAFTNALETIGRNRELEGRPPLKVVMLSNSDLIYGDVIEGFHLADELIYMQEQGIEELVHSEDMLLVMPQLSEYRKEKADTALYRLTKGTHFASVALDNRFPIEDRSQIGKRPLAEYKPICSVSGICIYKHKGGSGWYICDHISGRPKEYEDTDADRMRFLREQAALLSAHARKKVIFSSIGVQNIFKGLVK